MLQSWCSAVALRGLAAVAAAPHHGTGEANTGAQDVEANEAAVETNVSDIATFKPVLTVHRQSQAILLHSFIGHWHWKGINCQLDSIRLFVSVVFMMGFSVQVLTTPFPVLLSPRLFFRCLCY